MKSTEKNSQDQAVQMALSSFFTQVWSDWKYELTGFILFVFAWAAVTQFIFTRPELYHFKGFLPGPTLGALADAFHNSKFWISVFASLRRIVVGIAISALIGLPLGVLIGFFTSLRKLTYSPIQFIRMISPLSWMPIALLLFTSFESAVHFLIVMATICPIILNTAIGVMNINPQWLKMALNQGANNVQLLQTIVLPYSIPHMITSIRLALGIAWIVLVPAEFLGVSSGLGYLINDARDTMAYDKLMAIIIAIGILGFILDRIFQKLQYSCN
ncbi:ABC transporter permease [Desulfobacter latus]|uniref:ABC transporter permease n=1 Tax=Desulfobacter latus TaxID=2292 RepID=A0A850TAK6_9BACT|nr:ABC transporter permease [Desulfobacter latus]NWH06632.1 ABC transporter permease [Desulfobacter latus]